MGKYGDWGDDSYDDVDYLIDNDPIELGKLYRKMLWDTEKLMKSFEASRDFLHNSDWSGEYLVDDLVEKILKLGKNLD